VQQAEPNRGLNLEVAGKKIVTARLFRLPSFARRQYSGIAHSVRRKNENGGDMTRPRAADDFAVIRARMEELRRESAPEPRDSDSAKPQPQAAGNKPGLPLAVRRTLFQVRTG
jgi:hypothetical protein